MASFGFGAFVAAFTLATVGERVRSGMRITAGLFVYPIAFILFSLVTSFWLALPLLMLGGWAIITLLATCNTLLQTTTPDVLRGRVMSLYSMILVGFLPFGHMLAGWLADYLNSAPMAVRLSEFIVLLTAVVVYIWAPRVRQAE